MIRPESKRHIETFEYWYSLGGGSLTRKIVREVAEKMGINVRTFYIWYKKYGWKERRDRRNQSLKELYQEKQEELALVTIEEYRQIIARAVSEFKKNLESGKVVMDSTMDLERLARLDFLLQGKPTGDETQITIVTGIPRPKKIVVDAEVIDTELSGDTEDTNAIESHDADGEGFTTDRDI